MDVSEKATNDKRLIDANKLLKNGIRVSYGFDNDGVLLIPMGDVIRSIKKAPIIDAVEVVVRCRECKYHKDTPINEYKHCCLMGKIVWYNDFCSYGERKEGVDNG